MISSLLHLVGLRPRVYYTLANFRGGGGQGPPQYANVDCIKKSTFETLRVNKHTVVFSVSHGDAAPVRCALTLELITLKLLLENVHIDLYNGQLTAQIHLLWQLKNPGMCVLIFGIFGRKRYTLLQQHEF